MQHQHQQAGHLKTEEIRHAINGEDYKRAIKLALKLADKNDVARAMLAFCYDRTGRRDDALEICDSLGKAAQVNDSVLHWMGYILAHCRRLDWVARLRQEKLQLVKPSQGEAYFHAAIDAFFALVRLYDFKEADSILKKIMAANRAMVQPVMDSAKVSLWAATLGFLRAESAEDLNLALAESFLQKSGSSATQGLPLRRWIQVRRGKRQEALETLAFLPSESAASKKWMEGLLVRLSSSSSEDKEFSLLCDLVRGAPDDFRAYARMCVLASSEEEREVTLRRIIEEEATRCPSIRGPRLALIRLEFELLMSRGGDKAFKSAVIAFVRHFVDLNSVVFSDLQNDLILFCLSGSGKQNLPRPELPVEAQVCPLLLPPHHFAEIDRESRQWPCETISHRVLPETRQEFFAELWGMETSPQIVQILRYCGALEAHTSEQLVALVDQWLALPGDEWVLLSAHVLTDVFSLTEEKTLLFRACSALEKQLVASPDSFQLKLALHEVYSFWLGAPQCALPVFDSLKLKQVQFDALGHVGLADLASCGFLAEAKTFASSTCEFNARARTETAECFATAFEHCETSSPVEMYRLELRLRDSFQFFSSVVERCAVSLLPSTNKTSSLFTKLNVEVNNPPGKSAVCFTEHRLAVGALANRNRLDELVWNADLAVEFACDAPFGASFTKRMESQVLTGPNTRIPRDVLRSGEFLKSWKEKETNWSALRMSAFCALVAPEVNSTQLVELESLTSSLVSVDALPAPLSLLWQVGLEMVRLLHTKKIGENVANLLSEVEKTYAAGVEWAQNEMQANPRQFFTLVSVSLTHAGFWTYGVVLRFALQLKKSAAAFPFDVSMFSSIQALAAKAFLKIASFMKELKQEEEKRGVEVSTELQAVAKKVKKSHVESLHRLAQVAASFASFD